MRKNLRQLRILFASICLFAATLPSYADSSSSGITFLLTNGKQVSFTFESKPVIMLYDDALTITATGKSTAFYSFTDVVCFYCKTNDAAGIASFDFKDDVVTAKSLKAGEHISIASSDGRVLKNCQADSEGNARIDISSAPSETYVVSTDSGVSFKLTKK